MRARAGSLAPIFILAASLAADAGLAQVVDVRQGTNLSVAYSPSREVLAVDLLGGLWRLPVDGGGATALVAPGSGVAQPRFDAAGERIVAQRWLNGQWDIWMLDLTSGRWEALIESPGNEREPEFTADGRRVVFASDRSGRFDLWELDLASGALRQLTDEPGDAAFPSVSDSGLVAYSLTDAAGSALQVYTGYPRGDELLRSDATLSAPSWRPGGRVLVFNDRLRAERSELRLLIDADVPVMRPLTEDEDVFVGRVAWLSAEEYVYAADGQLWRRKIASTQRRPVHLFAGVAVDRTEPRPAPVQLDAAGPHPTHGIRDMALEPGGRRIAFAALGDLWLRDGRTLTRLTDDPFVDALPQFAPDGRTLVHLSDRGGNLDLWAVDLENASRRQLTNGDAPVSSAVLAGETVYFLAGGDLGARIASEVGRLQIDEPYSTQAITGELYDAGDLRVADGGLRIRARSGAPDARLEDIVLVQSLKPAMAESVDLPAPRDVAGSELTWSPAAPAEPFVVQAGRVFDGIRNEYSRHVDIHVTGQRISAIVARGRLPLPERVIDARDRTVMPGFIDVHAHHRRTHGERLGRLWLAFGVTTVREVGRPGRATLERAEAWSSGRRPGPRLILSSAPEPAEDFTPVTPATLASATSISEGFAHSVAMRDRYLERTRAVDPSAGLAETAWPESPDMPIALSPLNLSYQDSIAQIVGSGTFFATGLAALRAPGLGVRLPPSAVPELTQLYSPPARRTASAGGPAASSPLGPFTATLGRLQRSSGHIAIGSDAPAVPYGYGLHLELALLSETGIPNAQVLRWATSAGALALGLDQQLGTLEVGKLADFVIIDGDPLSEIGDTQKIEAVSKGGVVFDRASLLQPPSG